MFVIEQDMNYLRFKWEQQEAYDTEQLRLGLEKKISKLRKDIEVAHAESCYFSELLQ